MITNKNNKVSVIIPAFNKADFTKRAVLSVVKQTYANIEIIIVDDGSVDNTKKLLTSINDDRIKYFYKNNGGACSARNYGIKKSNGNFLAFLDCDDIYVETKIEDSLNALKKNPSYKFLYSEVLYIDFDDNIISKSKNYQNHPKSGWIGKKLILGNYNITNSTLVTYRKCIEEVGGFDENIFIPADREYLIRLSTKFKALHLNKHLTGYRVGNETIFNNLDKALIEFEYVLKKYKNTSIISNLNFYNNCKSNNLYNFAKLYAANNQLSKSKKLLFNSLYLNFINSSSVKKIIFIILIYLIPSFVYSYFKKFKEY